MRQLVTNSRGETLGNVGRLRFMGTQMGDVHSVCCRKQEAGSVVHGLLVRLQRWFVCGKPILHWWTLFPAWLWLWEQCWRIGRCQGTTSYYSSMCTVSDIGMSESLLAGTRSYSTDWSSGNAPFHSGINQRNKPGHLKNRGSQFSWKWTQVQFAYSVKRTIEEAMLSVL